MIAFLVAYLDIELKLVEVQPVKDTNIGKTCGDSDIFPLKMTRNVPLYCWPYNYLDNFTEFVAFAVLWQNDLSCGEDSCKKKEIDNENVWNKYYFVIVVTSIGEDIVLQRGPVWKTDAGRVSWRSIFPQYGCSLNRFTDF